MEEVYYSCRTAAAAAAATTTNATHDDACTIQTAEMSAAHVAHVVAAWSSRSASRHTQVLDCAHDHQPKVRRSVQWR